MFQIGQNNLKNMSEVMLSHRRSNVRVYWQYICWFYKCFRQILAVQWTFVPIFFCHSGQRQQHKSPMTQLFGIFFGQTLLFSLSTFFLGLPNNANASKEWKFATELVIIGEHIIFFSLKQPFGHNKRLQWKNKWTIMTLV